MLGFICCAFCPGDIPSERWEGQAMTTVERWGRGLFGAIAFVIGVALVDYFFPPAPMTDIGITSPSVLLFCLDTLAVAKTNGKQIAST
jgi:hypothetical protein